MANEQVRPSTTARQHQPTGGHRVEEGQTAVGTQRKQKRPARHRQLRLVKARWLQPIAILTLFLVVFTGIYVLATLELMEATKEAVDLTRQSLDLTRRSVEATEDALKLTEESNALTQKSNELTSLGLEESREQASESNRLTAESLAISQEALGLTQKQVEIAAQQAHMEEARLQPSIQVRQFQRRDELGDFYDVAEFWNRGEPVRSFGLRQWSFLQVSLVDADFKVKEVKFYPWWYFGPYETTLNEVGLLATFEFTTDSGYDASTSTSKLRSKRADLEELRRDAAAVIVADDFRVEIQPCVFFWMEYKDVAGRRHEKILFLHGLRSSTSYDYHGYTELPGVTFRDFIAFVEHFPPREQVPELKEIMGVWDLLREPSTAFGPFDEGERPGCYPYRLQGH